MHWLDTLILCLLAGGALVGGLMGFLWQMFWIVSVSAGLYCTMAFNEVGTALVQRHLMEGATPGAAQGTAYLLVFILVFVLVLILTVLLQWLVRKAHLQWLNRVLGAVLVATIVASGMGLTFLVLNSVPGSREVVEQSKIAPVLVAGIQSMLAHLPEEYRNPMEEKMEQTLEQIPKLPSTPQLNKGKAPSLHISPTPEDIIRELTKQKK